MCSQIGMPAPSKFVCAGRDMSAMSSMFNESIPTKASPGGDERLARLGGQVRVGAEVAVGAPVAREVGAEKYGLAVQVARG